MVDILSFDADDIEHYADILTATAIAVANNGLEAGAAALDPIAGQIWMGRLTATSRPCAASDEPRPRVRDENLRARVFVRDRFRCTHCGGRAVPRSILVAIHDLFPSAIPYDAHYTRGLVHPVFWALAPEADHVYPHAYGGENALENLTTVHAACNTRKSDGLVENPPKTAATQPTDAWYGLASFYPALIAAGAAEVRQRYHREWSRRYTTLMARDKCADEGGDGDGD